MAITTQALSSPLWKPFIHCGHEIVMKIVRKAYRRSTMNRIEYQKTIKIYSKSALSLTSYWQKLQLIRNSFPALNFCKGLKKGPKA